MNLKEILGASFSCRRGWRLQGHLLCVPHGLILYFFPGVVTCCLKWLLSCQESWYLPAQMEKCCRCNPSNKRQNFFPITFFLSPTISVLSSNHHKKPGTGKNTFLILATAAASRVIFYTSISRRGVCIIAWKSGKNLPVWETGSGKTRLLQLFWKLWRVESSRTRARIRGEEKHRGEKKQL